MEFQRIKVGPIWMEISSNCMRVMNRAAGEFSACVIREPSRETLMSRLSQLEEDQPAFDQRWLERGEG